MVAAIAAAPIAQGAYIAYTPGSGYKDNIPAAVAGAGLVSNGDLKHLATVPGNQTYYNVNPEIYPGELGLGNMPGAVSGKTSVKSGAQGIVNFIVDATGGDTSADVVLPGGSQGALVGAQAAVQLAELGYTNVYGIFFSSPSGFLDRFGPNTPVLWFGLDPGAPSLPETGEYIEVGNEFDPMVRTSRFLLDPFLVPNFILGFIFYHGKIYGIDYEHPDNVVEIDGNVTKVTLHNQWVPLLAPVALLLESRGLHSEWLTPFDDILRGMMRLGLESEGTFQVMPSPGQMVQGVRYTLEGFVQAIKHTVQLMLHQPLTPRNEGQAPLTDSPVTDLIDKVLGPVVTQLPSTEEAQETTQIVPEVSDNGVVQRSSEEAVSTAPNDEPELIQEPQAPSGDSRDDSALQAANETESVVANDDAKVTDREPAMDDSSPSEKEPEPKDDDNEKQDDDDSGAQKRESSAASERSTSSDSTSSASSSSSASSGGGDE